MKTETRELIEETTNGWREYCSTGYSYPYRKALKKLKLALSEENPREVWELLSVVPTSGWKSWGNHLKLENIEFKDLSETLKAFKKQEEERLANRWKRN